MTALATAIWLEVTYQAWRSPDTDNYLERLAFIVHVNHLKKH